MIDHTALAPMVRRVTDSVHSSFPEHHSKEDTESALWVWVFSNKKTVDGIIRNTARPEGVLYNLMTKEASKHLKKEDAAAYGYAEEDAFYYTTETVKTLLEVVFDYEDWQSFGQKGDGQPRARKLANQTGDYVAMLIDVKSAVEKLNEEQYNVILWTYKYHYTGSMLADTLEIGEEAAKKRVSRAVDAVRRRLGVKPYSELRKGYEGRREPSTTANALATTEHDYNG